jgi:hypothetical protein
VFQLEEEVPRDSFAFYMPAYFTFQPNHHGIHLKGFDQTATATARSIGITLSPLCLECSFDGASDVFSFTKALSYSTASTGQASLPQPVCSNKQQTGAAVTSTVTAEQGVNCGHGAGTCSAHVYHLFLLMHTVHIVITPVPHCHRAVVVVATAMLGMQCCMISA